MWGLARNGAAGNRRGPLPGLLIVVGVVNEPAVAACVESSTGRSARAAERRSALSIRECALERTAGTRAGVRPTRRTLRGVELVPVVAGELGGEAARVRSGAFGRLPARTVAGAMRGLAAIAETVHAVDHFGRRALTARTGRRGTEAVTQCPLSPVEVRWDSAVAGISLWPEAGGGEQSTYPLRDVVRAAAERHRREATKGEHDDDEDSTFNEEGQHAPLLSEQHGCHSSGSDCPRYVSHTHVKMLLRGGISEDLIPATRPSTEPWFATASLPHRASPHEGERR